MEIMTDFVNLKASLRVLLAVLILLALLPAWNAGEASTRPSTLYQTDPPYELYLPLITRNYPRLPSIFGVEMTSLDTTKVNNANNANAYWARYFSFSWASIEPVRTATPTYNWSAVDEAGLINASANGLKVVATVKFTPSWAQKYLGVSCGPMAANSIDEFAQFMHNLVARYSVPPYNIKYWEIGNEVDIDPDLVPPDSIFGCWGDEADSYYGGGYYADMLRQVYPAMKSADGQATVIIGGLLLDCDPTNPPPGKTCKPSRFLEGILRNGGGGYFDAVSFHSFALYLPGQIYEMSVSWSARGGVLLGKISFLREVLATYGYNKPLYITESSLVCPEWVAECGVVSSGFLEAQADYVAWLYLRSWAQGLPGVMWYTLEDSGWRSSGLYLSSTPKPAYYALQFATRELDEAQLVGSVSQYPTLIGYDFRSPGKRIWVLWSPTRTDTVITLPAGVVNVFDKYGNPRTPVAGQLTVNSPVYIELTP
jgi:hypothetical protein